MSTLTFVSGLLPVFSTVTVNVGFPPPLMWFSVFRLRGSWRRRSRRAARCRGCPERPRCERGGLLAGHALEDRRRFEPADVRQEAADGVRGLDPVGFSSAGSAAPPAGSRGRPRRGRAPCRRRSWMLGFLALPPRHRRHQCGDLGHPFVPEVHRHQQRRAARLSFLPARSGPSCARRFRARQSGSWLTWTSTFDRRLARRARQRDEERFGHLSIRIPRRAARRCGCSPSATGASVLSRIH